MECKIELPWPPSVNHYKQAGALRVTKSGKLYQPRINTAATTQFFFDVWNQIRKLKATEGLKSFDSAKIEVHIQLWMPDNRKRDIDNPCKLLLDSLQHAKLYDDDSQIIRLVVQKMGIIPKGKVIVTVLPIGE
jgi:crossover junction endodeoxyribonuclease RusA